MHSKEKIYLDKLMRFFLSLVLMGYYTSLAYPKEFHIEKSLDQYPFFLVDNFEYDDSPLDHGWVLCSDAGNLEIVFDEEVGSRVLKSKSILEMKIKACYPQEELSLDILKPYLSVKIKGEDCFALGVEVSDVNDSAYFLNYVLFDTAVELDYRTCYVRLANRFQDGKWHFLERDLAKDLLEAFGVQFKSVKSFCILGSGYLDNLKLYFFEKESPSFPFEIYECASAEYLERNPRYRFVEGVLQTDYKGDIGWQYQPVDIAFYGLACWNSFYKSGDSSWMGKFLTQADYFVSERFDVGSCSVLRYHFKAWNFRVPWISAMAQGLALSLLSRVYAETGNQIYLNTAYEIFKSFGVDLEPGGVRDVLPDGSVWYPEYPEFSDGRKYVLNGFVFALLGLHDFYLLTKEKQAKIWFNQGIEALKANIERFDAGTGSFYDLNHFFIYSQNQYHKLHTRQMRQLYEITGETIFSKWRWIFDNYTSNTFEYTDSPLNHNWGKLGVEGEGKVVWDDSLHSRVLRMSGNPVKEFGLIYPKDGQDMNIDRSLVSWKFKSEGGFLVNFTIKTTSGHLYNLIYKRNHRLVPFEGGKVIFSLDNIFEENRWYSVERDLRKDLKGATGEGFCHLFCISLWGNFCFDNLKLVKKLSQTIDDFQYVDSPLSHGWEICDGMGDISTIYDDSIRSTVLRTTTPENTNTNFCVRYPRDDIKLCRAEDFLHLKIKDKDNFIIYVLVHARNGGEYYLRYESTEGEVKRSGQYIFIPIGNSFEDGVWHKFVRNLDEDLYSGIQVHYDYAKRLILRGDMKVDDVTFSHFKFLSDFVEDTIDLVPEVVLPSSFYLRQNYPNPFNQSTVIEFGLAQEGETEVSIFNILGQRVKVLTHSYLPSGRHKIVWDGDDQFGNPVASGIYFCRLKSGNSVSCRKVVLLK